MSQATSALSVRQIHAVEAAKQHLLDAVRRLPSLPQRLNHAPAECPPQEAVTPTVRLTLPDCKFDPLPNGHTPFGLLWIDDVEFYVETMPGGGFRIINRQSREHFRLTVNEREPGGHACNCPARFRSKVPCVHREAFRHLAATGQL